MLIEDHFVINVARRIQAVDAQFGPYHEHYLAIELRPAAANSRSEAQKKFDEVCGFYPEPDYHCTMMQVVCRGVPLADSAAK